MAIIDAVEADLGDPGFRGCAFNNASIEFGDPNNGARTVSRQYREGLRDRLINLATALRGGTTLPYARSWLALMGCAGAGKVYRFAQVVAAATLALEISASAAMATAGSENFFRAHHERGGLR